MTELSKYGVAIFDDGHSKHQRYFTEFIGEDNAIDIKLPNGEWVVVQRRAVIRWPKSEKEETEQ